MPQREVYIKKKKKKNHTEVLSAQPFFLRTLIHGYRSLVRSSEEEFVVSENESEAESDASNNSGKGRRKHRKGSRGRSPAQHRRSSRKRRRPKGYSDEEEEETDEEDEDEIGTTFEIFFTTLLVLTLMHVLKPKKLSNTE